MPPSANQTPSRIELRIPSEQKAVIARAAALEHLDVTGFILAKVLPEAHAVIARAERVVLSERDSLRVLDLLENPPAPSARLVRAAESRRTRK